MADKEVLELDQLMRLTGVGVYESSNRAGIAPSNWSRWRGHGISPSLSKFGKMRVAVIELAIESGALPIDCDGKTMAQLVDMAKENAV